MAIKPEDEFVGKINAGNANYPQGSARDITSAGDGTGTPWKARLINDIWGFTQRLLNVAGITPSGSPDTVLASDYFNGLMTVVTRPALTVATMAALTGIRVGNVIQTAEFSTGNGGGGTYNAVAVGTTENVDLPNTESIIVSTVDPAICFVLRNQGQLDVSKLGADGLANSSSAIQRALAINNDVLISENSNLTSGQITIPSNTRLTIDGTLKASVNLATALITNSDTTNGNTNIRITGKGNIDGNKANQASGDTYCIRFEKVDESIIDIQKVNACSLQTVPGNEGAIYLVTCTDTKVIDVESTDHDATGVLGIDCIRCGSIRVHSHTNTASGIIWDRGNDNYSDHDHIHHNSFSNLNMTGKRSKISFPNAYNSSFSNLNFGESADATRGADDSILIGGSSRLATLDGLTVQRGSNILIIGTKFDANVRHNARVFGSAGKTTWLSVECSNGSGLSTHGLSLEAGNDHVIGGGSEFHNNGLRGIDISGTVSGVIIDDTVKCYNNGQATSGNSAGVFLGSTTSKCSIAGEYFDTQTGVETQEAGIWNGGGASHTYNAPDIHNNKTYTIRETSSPTLTTKREVRLGLDAMQGSFFLTAGTATTVTNNNSFDVETIIAWPANGAARTLNAASGIRVVSVVQGTSFLLEHGTAAGSSAEQFYFKMV